MVLSFILNALCNTCSAAAVEELDKFIDGVTGEKMKDIRGGAQMIHIQTYEYTYEYS